ncbi:MAG TPA: hypothetical protein VIV40_37795 [Kofleriaceae bacterium]
MTRAVVALLVSVSLLGCFPHSARNRRYAQIGEGTALLAGIAVSAFANTAADCDEMLVTGVNNANDSCKSKANWLSAVGVVLIVGGLLGFVATVSTAEAEPKPKVVEIKDTTPAKPEDAPVQAAPPAATPTDNTQATDPNAPTAAGSAAATPSAPQH